MNKDQWIALGTHFRHFILNQVFPRVCVLCGDPGDDDLDLCAGCLRDLPRPGPACPRCGGALAAGRLQAPCGPCLARPPVYQETRTVLRYADPAAYLIQQLKFGNAHHLAGLFASLVARELGARAPRPDLLVPVPLHPRRLRRRGYNQSQEIARRVARRLAIPMEVRGMKRIRHTAEQSSLSMRARGANVRRAFVCERDLQGRQVAIIDDVMTTGHTVNEFARVLDRAGAGRIQVWVVARTG